MRAIKSDEIEERIVINSENERETQVLGEIFFFNVCVCLKDW